MGTGSQGLESLARLVPSGTGRCCTLELIQLFAAHPFVTQSRGRATQENKARCLAEPTNHQAFSRPQRRRRETICLFKFCPSGRTGRGQAPGDLITPETGQ